MYLNVHSLEIPSDPNDPSQALVAIKIGETTSKLQGELLLGGQRVMLPPWIADLVINALNEGKPVTITTGQYRSEILPENFSTVYQKLMTHNQPRVISAIS